MTRRNNYNYIFVAHLFIKVDQNIVRLYYNLYTKGKSFEQFSHKAKMKIPNFLLRAVRAFQFTKQFNLIRKKYRMKEMKVPIISAQYDGHCLVKLRHGGYKIFDLKKGTVTTTYSNKKSLTEIETEVKNIQLAEKSKLAPKLITWNINRRFLIEEYKNINRCSYNMKDADKFVKHITPLIHNIMYITKPESTNLDEYALDKLNYIESRIHCKRLDYKTEYDIIQAFLKKIKARINKKNARKHKLTLVCSHGNF